MGSGKEKNFSPAPAGCFMPMNAIAVHPQGQAHFCLTSTQPPSGDLEGFRSRRREVHRELLEGRWPDSCRRCSRMEQQGLQSRRERVWERKALAYGAAEAAALVRAQDTPTIRHLEISFSNVCNLSCAMCSSEFSTGWRLHDEEARRRGLEFRDFTAAYDRPARVSKKLLAEVLTFVDDLDLIIVKGGEPTREPLCLEFLKEVAARTKDRRPPWVFIQSNGTRPPQEWIHELEGLRLEIGFSLDGWGDVFRWIRGTDFDRVLGHFKTLHDVGSVLSLSMDFTLSLFNCFHLPEFLERAAELGSVLPKLKEVPVFQWVQQPYASPLHLAEGDRAEIRDRIAPLLSVQGDFFLDHESLSRVLLAPRPPRATAEQALRWLDYMNSMRGFTLGPLDTRIRASVRAGGQGPLSR